MVGPILHQENACSAGRRYRLHLLRWIFAGLAGLAGALLSTSPSRARSTDVAAAYKPFPGADRVSTTPSAPEGRRGPVRRNVCPPANAPAAADHAGRSWAGRRPPTRKRPRQTLQ